jgi:hypothetical protein
MSAGSDFIEADNPDMLVDIFGRKTPAQSGSTLPKE